MDKTKRARHRRLAKRKIEGLREAARNPESLGLLARAGEEEKARELEGERADLALADSRMTSEGAPATAAEAERPEDLPAPSGR